jgi:hypothetical protein
MPSDPSAISTVSLISAATAVISAFLSYMSYRKSSSQFETNQLNNFINNTKEKLDKIYIDISEFIQKFTGKRDTKEKRIVRDRIIFSLEAIRVDLSLYELEYTKIEDDFADITSLK